MTEYHRAHVPGARWFFTANLAQRKWNSLLVDRIDLLRVAFVAVRGRHPFHMDAVVILPDHLHCIMTLPEGDADFSTRWNLIKGSFSRAIETGERISPSRAIRGERGIWQRRFWEHLIRDQDDFNRHSDYIHWKSGQAWLGTPRCRLAAFELSRVRETRNLPVGLVLKDRRGREHGVTRAMRFVNSPHPTTTTLKYPIGCSDNRIVNQPLNERSLLV